MLSFKQLLCNYLSIKQESLQHYCMYPIHIFLCPLPHLKRIRGKKKENKKYQPANRMHTCHRRDRAALGPELGKSEGGRTERRVP